MSDHLASLIPAIYESIASEFDRDRGKDLNERTYLDAVLSQLGGRRRVLDLGCGSGDPIARYFIDANCDVTGVDIAPAMLAMCRSRFPTVRWIEADMRYLALSTQFDAIVAWDSFFHLTAEDQRSVFEVFERHAAPGATLLFTSGPSEGTSIGEMYGNPLFHASLSQDEYRSLLKSHGFSSISLAVEDPNCGGHTVWLARKS